MWLSPLGICVASGLFCPLHFGAFEIKRLSRGGETTVEVYIFSALYWESLRNYCVWQIFIWYFNYVLVVLNSDFVVFLNKRNFFVIGRRFLACLYRISRFFFALLRCSVYPKPLFNLFFCACVYFCKTGFNSVILCPVAVLERFTKQYFHDNLLCTWTHQQKQLLTKGIYINGCCNPMVQPQHLHIVPFIILIIVTIILLLLLLLFEKVILVLIQS